MDRKEALLLLKCSTNSEQTLRAWPSLAEGLDFSVQLCFEMAAYLTIAGELFPVRLYPCYEHHVLFFCFYLVHFSQFVISIPSQLD